MPERAAAVVVGVNVVDIKYDYCLICIKISLKFFEFNLATFEIFMGKIYMHRILK